MFREHALAACFPCLPGNDTGAALGDPLIRSLVILGLEPRRELQSPNSMELVSLE